MAKSTVVPSTQSLKQLAKQIASDKKIPLSKAQDLVANSYGFTHWSIMLKNFNSTRTDSIKSIWRSFLPGEMLLLSAEKGVGKFSMGLNLAEHALREKFKVKYLLLHSNASLILDRLSKITSCKIVEGWLSKQRLIIKNDVTSPESLLNEVINEEPGTVLIIDYLQAINHKSNNTQCYSELLKQMKVIAQEKSFKLIFLGQAYPNNTNDNFSHLEEKSKTNRYFSHVIYLEKRTIRNIEHRNIELLKSIHYKKQSSLVQLDKHTFRFV